MEGELQPHVYRTPSAAKIFFVCFGSLLVAGGLFFFAAPIWTSLAGITPRGGAVEAFALTTVLGCCGFGTGALMIISSITGHVYLYPDAIVVGSALPFWNRRLERKDIGAKMTMFIYVRTYVLYPRTRNQKPLRVGVMGSEDDFYRQWMESIPEADKDFLRRRRRGDA
ncbi:MAG TPA: hypothetical protein VLV50_05740 [Stellaceae bacterium]|nr:hypothetical protein [Stellaceae bacterium]